MNTAFNLRVIITTALVAATTFSGARAQQRPAGNLKGRVIQSNAAGDNLHVNDPATNKVVGVISDIEVPHGVVLAPDGSRLYVTDEALSTVDFVDAKTLKVTKRVKLSGHPNNLAVSRDGRKVYAGISQAPGAVDVID